MDGFATLEELALGWCDATRALGRVQHAGGSLGNRDRRELRRVREAMATPAVAATLAEVVQPMYSRSLLAEHLKRAEALLGTLLHAEPGLEKVVLHPAQVAWLVEFLSACCLSLLRVLATRRPAAHALALGS